MAVRWMIRLLLVACLPACLAAQLVGSFSLEKDTFARGEPVFLHFTLANKGRDTDSVIIGDPDQPFCSGLLIAVSNDPPEGFPCSGSRNSGCNGSGPIQQQQVLPGQAYKRRVLLNFHHEIGEVGDYWVEAKYYNPSDSQEQASAKPAFRVDGEAPPFSDWKPWLDQLKSPLPALSTEAARTLASLAPPSFEDTLLAFPSSPEFRKYAPMAFHRLNTRRSIEALAQLMNGPATGEQIEAARYLAETRDQKWYPLLRDAAEKNAGISAYPTYAAELGGDKMLPELIALEKSQDQQYTRLNAIAAMGSTGSRAAIPLLLTLLSDPDVNVSNSASYGLQLLTRRTAARDSRSRDRQAEYLRWSRWWEREGTTAPIYRDEECDEMLPLP